MGAKFYFWNILKSAPATTTQFFVKRGFVCGGAFAADWIFAMRAQYARMVRKALAAPKLPAVDTTTRI